MQEKEYSAPLHIYRASAGSGKTFLLTTEYLCLLFEHPFKYREILAVTFTNKATEEMKHRILSELRKLAKGETSSYGAILLQRFPHLEGDGQLALQADRIYRTILHDYAKFSVSTIDSFVQQVIRAFAYEIGLDAGYELQLNQEIVKEDLADRMFDLLETNDTLFEWIKRMAVERIENGKPWDFRNELLEFAGEIFKERFIHFEDNVRRMADPAHSFETLRRQLQDELNAMENTMTGIAKEAIQLIASSGLQQDDFMHGRNAFINYFGKITRDRDFAPGQRVLDAAGNPEKWFRKTADATTRENMQALYPALNNLLEKAINHYRENNFSYQTARAVMQKLNNLNLLRVLAGLLAEYRRDNNALLITDSQQLLRELVRDNDAPFIYEKTGTRYQHFLLDEFQDTSSFQWDNFRPLVEQSVAGGNFNLVVGDVKQSIYRWRNGDWRLLQEKVKHDIGAAGVQESSLLENYRSRANIIDFNNFLFERTPQLLQQQFNEEMEVSQDPVIRARLQSAGYFNIIEQAYADAAQRKPAGCPPGGWLDIRFFPKEDSRSPNSWCIAAEAQLCTQIEWLIQEKGFNPSQITLLTRNNNEARYLIDLLLQYQQREEAKVQYGLISADALVLMASPAIQLLVAALRYLVNEKDQLALVELVQANALRQSLDLSNPDWYRVELNHALNMLPGAFTAKRRLFLQVGLYECVEELISIFSLDEWVAEQAYLLTFRDIVNQFSTRGRSDMREFLEWWAHEGNEKALPLSSSLNAIQVMTIHKSKGLAFDVVILPYADWKLVNDNGTLWCDWKSEDTDIDIVPVSINGRLAESAFAFEYFEEQLMARMDALNMLYVALTRAREAIIIMAPLPSKKNDQSGSSSGIGELIYQAASRHPAFKDERLVIEGETSRAFAAGEESEVLEIRPFTTSPALLKDLREPAREELILQYAGSGPQRIGQLAHLALSRISTKGETAQVLKRMQLEGLLTKELLPAVQESVEQALEQPQLAEWFSGKYQSINERAILVQGGAVRRPDKVLVAPTETILLDFKFTHEPSPAHGTQVKEYVDLLHRMGYPSIRAYVYYGYNQSLVPLSMLATKQGDLFS